MKLHTSTGVKKISSRAAKIVITTDDISDMLGLQPSTIRRLIRVGKLKFTGNAVQDMEMLLALRAQRLAKFNILPNP